jgi:hypothetical protein
MGANKICTVATSEDGDRIYCLYKEESETLAKGFYDFIKERFIVTEFYTNKLKEGQSPREAIINMKQTLDLDYDWELTDEDKIIQNIEEGMMKKKKRKRKKKTNDGDK